jgi:putative transposase
MGVVTRKTLAPQTECRGKRNNHDNNRRTTIRQWKYLNSIIEQGPRCIKRITRTVSGFRSFNSARNTLTEIELLAMINKGRMKKAVSVSLSPAEQFYVLAA